MTVQNGKAVEKTVATGRRITDWIEIVSGLNAGELVVLEPATLRTGQPVSVNEPRPPQIGKPPETSGP